MSPFGYSKTGGDFALMLCQGSRSRCGYGERGLSFLVGRAKGPKNLLNLSVDTFTFPNIVSGVFPFRIMKLKNKIAIVTGGNSGIGKGIAKAFSKEGAKIAIVDIHREKGDAAVAEIRTLGSEAIFVPGDVSELEDTKNYIRQTLEAFGRIDIMVNNAAVIHQACIVDLAEDDWDRVIKNNLRSVFLGSKYAALEMIKQGGGGRIINISSIHAVLSEPQAGHYSASKGAINAFTRTLASELAPHKITANVLQPGATYTELTTPMYTPNVKKALFKRVPLRAIANVEDIACGAVFMASDEAWYMTGSSITIDGGYVMDGSLPDAEYWSEK